MPLARMCVRLTLGDLHHARTRPGPLRLRRVPGTHLQAQPRRHGTWLCSASTGKQLKQFGWIHEIACPSENVLFVAELLNWRVQKLVLHPKK